MAVVPSTPARSADIELIDAIVAGESPDGAKTLVSEIFRQVAPYVTEFGEPFGLALPAGTTLRFASPGESDLHKHDDGKEGC
ncbi:MAG: hypothetical protein ACRDTD_25720, partial [Pseudonocardiaceae bacterium]